MRGLFYFVPGGSLAKCRAGESLVHGALPGELRAILADVRGTQDLSFFEPNSPGPGGQAGLLLFPFGVNGEAAREIGLYPERQTWKQSPCGTFWIGFANAELPTPEGLRRRTKLFEGHDVELNGQTWHVPVVRRPPNVTSLPREMEFDAAGNLTYALAGVHQQLWDRLGNYVETIYGPREYSPDDDREWVPLAIDVLAINYRVGRTTQNVLHLVNSDTYQQVLNAAVDVQHFLAIVEQKKSEAAAATPPSATG
jgi:hypothetical protein